LEGFPMDDYHEFRRDHVVEIEMWRQHWSPSYVSIIHDVLLVMVILCCLLLV
jgi:hypothetical protein